MRIVRVLVIVFCLVGGVLGMETNTTGTRLFLYEAHDSANLMMVNTNLLKMRERLDAIYTNAGVPLAEALYLLTNDVRGVKGIYGHGSGSVTGFVDGVFSGDVSADGAGTFSGVLNGGEVRENGTNLLAAIDANSATGALHSADIAGLFSTQVVDTARIDNLTTTQGVLRADMDAAIVTNAAQQGQIAANIVTGALHSANIAGLFSTQVVDTARIDNLITTQRVLRADMDAAIVTNAAQQGQIAANIVTGALHSADIAGLFSTQVVDTARIDNLTVTQGVVVAAVDANTATGALNRADCNTLTNWLHTGFVGNVLYFDGTSWVATTNLYWNESDRRLHLGGGTNFPGISGVGETNFLFTAGTNTATFRW